MYIYISIYIYIWRRPGILGQKKAIFMPNAGGTPFLVGKIRAPISTLFKESMYGMTQNWPFGGFFLNRDIPKKKVLLSAVMLNMLNHVESPLKNASFSCHVEYVEYVECFGNYEGPFLIFWGGWVSSKMVQHIQHIQHDSRKKHIFGGGVSTKSTYSTYST